ncbi:MAG: O-methyltransferase [Candidatus Promineifilaceae bacterium]|jgi:caffeoyl-CoA O-methyltransferase
MFQIIPDPIKERMRSLEKADALDRLDGTPQPERLRQIPPITGRFLALMAANTPAGKMIEVGTSAGYSTMWLSLTDRKIMTFEVLDRKYALAQETFSLAEIDDCVDLIHGDARDYLGEMNDIAFCFLDAEKEIYQDCYDLVVPNLVSGGLLLADNVISHAKFLEPFVENAAADNRVDTVVVPIGKGLLFCRKI